MEESSILVDISNPGRSFTPFLFVLNLSKDLTLAIVFDSFKSSPTSVNFRGACPAEPPSLFEFRRGDVGQGDTMDGEVIHISDLSFGDIVLTQTGYVLVDFYLASLPDCQRQGVVIEDIAPKYKDKIVMAKLDMDKNPGIVSRYKATSAPTLILFKDGEEIDRMTGFISEQELINYFDKLLKKAEAEKKRTKSKK